MTRSYNLSPRCTVAVLAVVVLVCLSALLDAQVPEADSGWKAPPREASRSNPLASRPDAAAGGAKLFQQRCVSCHGADGRGSSKGPDLTRPSVQAQTDGSLFWKISTGNSRSGMPAFSFLPPLQRWQLVLHLRAAR